MIRKLSHNTNLVDDAETLGIPGPSIIMSLNGAILRIAISPAQRDRILNVLDGTYPVASFEVDGVAYKDSYHTSLDELMLYTFGEPRKPPEHRPTRTPMEKSPPDPQKIARQAEQIANLNLEELGW